MGRLKKAYDRLYDDFDITRLLANVREVKMTQNLMLHDR